MCIISKGTMLYRYNLGNGVPEAWSTDFHSPEYVNGDLGYKNQIGAFFFYFNEETAINVLTTAIKKANSKATKYQNNTITSCQLMDDIRILDLTKCETPLCVITKLWDKGIDVLNDNFLRHDNGVFPFGSLAESFCYIQETEGSSNWNAICKRLHCAKEINDFFYNLVGYTGQLLTDFENGERFKALLLEKGYEGYLFDEEKTSPTLCIFDSAKLSSPTHAVL